MTDTYRTERDSMGEIAVPADKLWGAQTQRSYQNFHIGEERMPRPVIYALARIKQAAAMANHTLVPNKMTEQKHDAIVSACSRILSGELDDQFPLRVWQTGSGTQTNMNVNEVIANIANAQAKQPLLHSNDDVNMSQSSNDVFPSAMHIAAILSVEQALLPAAENLAAALRCLEQENEDVVKSGRTHLQDATPIRFSQEISGWRASIEADITMITDALEHLRPLALGGTAVGTGLNAPCGFDKTVASILSDLCGTPFRTADNKFHALSSKGELVALHGAIKALACDLMKIANDIRWLASGPRCGLGEITIPENEPGSSIMPGKVNPTQCEAITMIAVQVMGNDTTISIAASQGNFELNVFMPVLAYNLLQSVRLLSDGMNAFREHCIMGIRANREKMRDNLHNSLMLATALNPHIGYENAAKAVQKAHREGTSLRAAVLSLGYLSAEEFDRLFHPEQMV